MGNEMESHFQPSCQLTYLGLGLGNYIKRRGNGGTPPGCIVLGNKVGTEFGRTPFRPLARDPLLCDSQRIGTLSLPGSGYRDLLGDGTWQ